jgi:hypothetical protein
MTNNKKCLFKNFISCGQNKLKNLELCPSKCLIKYKMISHVNIKDLETLMKDYKKLKQTRSNYLKK